ncbi:hypothetical protein CYPRO_1316 [Cyclonatronum proteinivorum]|uniref:Uncharacterized protein n=1 Tax=Cyclonatronum proteinivorum TaxID=1457365 RepID=A0A345UJC1_9BACT|nr:hypothetical protein CYPRO_1316 [Cyclonatronum proteinivorum]
MLFYFGLQYIAERRFIAFLQHPRPTYGITFRGLGAYKGSGSAWLVHFAKSCLSCNPKNPVQNAKRRGKAICVNLVSHFPTYKPRSAVCGPIPRVPTQHREPWPFGACRGFVPVTPRPFAALTRAPLSRGEFCAFFVILIYFAPSLRPPSKPAVCGPRSAVLG